MSLTPKCCICDTRLANPYGGETRCDRCKQDCPTCGGNIAQCQHKLTNMVERELRATIEMQRKDAA